MHIDIRHFRKGRPRPENTPDCQSGRYSRPVQRKLSIQLQPVKILTFRLNFSVKDGTGKAHLNSRQIFVGKGLTGLLPQVFIEQDGAESAYLQRAAGPELGGLAIQCMDKAVSLCSFVRPEHGQIQPGRIPGRVELLVAMIDQEVRGFPIVLVELEHGHIAGPVCIFQLQRAFPKRDADPGFQRSIGSIKLFPKAVLHVEIESHLQAVHTNKAVFAQRAAGIAVIEGAQAALYISERNFIGISSLRKVLQEGSGLILIQAVEQTGMEHTPELALGRAEASDPQSFISAAFPAEKSSEPIRFGQTVKDRHPRRIPHRQLQAGVGSLPVDPVVDILAGESELPDRLFFISQTGKVTIRSVGLINNDQQVTFACAVKKAVLGSLALTLEKVLHVRHQLIFAVHDA